MIIEELADKTVFLTGGTGFVGTALIERVLHDLPTTKLVLLIRPGRRASAAARFEREILKNNCFDSLRAAIGSERFRSMVEQRITVVEGDVGSDGLGLDAEGFRRLGECDVAIHSAATVSFDAPIDSAVEVNLLGPSRVATTYREACEQAGRIGHLVCVSTAYVAGSRRGDAHEESLAESNLYPKVSWRSEVEAARRMRSEVEVESRSRENLERFRKLAAREVGAAGVALLADRTDRIRQDWVKEQLVILGKARAASLGWPDAYAYTKAFGEIALSEQGRNLAISVVRPSIIESALERPYPGWIRGFRMAEPVIISFARGLLAEFPGVTEGTIDVIPVDLVVSAILAVAAQDGPQAIKYYHVASGSTNPLRYGQLLRLVRTYFGEHPLYDDRGQPIKLPEWENPGRSKIKRQLVRANKALDLVDQVASLLPLRGSKLSFASDLDEKREAAKRALTYVDLYGSYAECEANYLIDNLLELQASLDQDDLDSFDFDPRQVDWERFVPEVHLPSIVQHSRVKTAPTSNTSTAAARRRRQLSNILDPSPKLVAFDLENTIISANVVDSFAFLSTKRLSTGERNTMLASLLIEGPSLLKLDRSDRSDFLRFFYKRYAGADPAQLGEDSWNLLSEYLLMKVFPSAIARVRQHRALGHRTVLITGALDFVVRPLAPLFDEIVAAEMSVDEHGRLTGEVPVTPPIGESRAAILSEVAVRHGLSLQETIAYADSTSDLPMLEAAGIAVCVNPEAKLLTIAQRRGWRIENWSKAQGQPSLVLPIGGRR
ncbi:MAG: HAD-IB family hydrolase [Acidimicrobiales bacterium]